MTWRTQQNVRVVPEKIARHYAIWMRRIRAIMLSPWYITQFVRSFPLSLSRPIVYDLSAPEVAIIREITLSLYGDGSGENRCSRIRILNYFLMLALCTMHMWLRGKRRFIWTPIKLTFMRTACFNLWLKLLWAIMNNALRCAFASNTWVYASLRFFPKATLRSLNRVTYWYLSPLTSLRMRSTSARWEINSYSCKL